MSLFFLLSLPLLLSSPPPLNPYPYDTSYRIDCGGQTNFTNNFNDSWLSDRFFTGGSPSLVAEPHLFLQQQEKTIRFFPISFGKKNCYILNVPNGRYHFRMFFVYDNYDGKLHSPSFDVSVEGTLVFSWRSPWKEDFSRTGAYSDLFAFVKDGEADICFYSIATDPPVIGSLEIIQVDPLSYDSSTTGDHLILINYGRLTCGSGSLGSGLTNDTDLFGRGWQTDVDFLKGNGVSIKAIATRNNIRATNQEHNYFPMHLYQTAVTVVGDGALEYELPVDAKMDYLVWFHFAEIDSSITAAGQRVIDVHINGRNVSRIDIFKQVGSFTAFNWHYVVKNLNSTTLSVKLVPVAGSPLISGLENYALVPRDLATVTEQVTAMRALKESLRVPDRMGWNGDPCAPPTWDAWEGVTCHPNKDKSALVVSQIDLGSQGLKGYISEQIGLLSNLVSLNLSYNSLHGTIPSGLGQKYLTRLDLSNNFLSGSIPDSLISSSLQLVLLNDNEFEGQVPYELYSIGVHGGAIDTCSKEK
ncbi:PREDICTED: probable leucine-rich repeat receptor-like protein kinase At2g28990 isoform X2 [Nelumbo nucifera]|uniref:Probable leucine-rich repeat receptor-like protein kinase At2g28990 isoform X2 n=1 Tax=Nelumbo nucifera TaxID=4432 RepID=A0A1U8A8H2_NELNU|nr:PREDICTED: probable leucine-rich repeat receptor-like protein kinase At2g28990 isoform X2 [Nelumbo nucifera]